MTTDKSVDEQGIPTGYDINEPASPYCPDKPCTLCTGNSEVYKDQGKNRRKLTSWEWCQEMDTCAATVDWDVIFGH